VLPIMSAGRRAIVRKLSPQLVRVEPMGSTASCSSREACLPGRTMRVGLANGQLYDQCGPLRLIARAD
jgi:hypothetical protein